MHSPACFPVRLPVQRVRLVLAAVLLALLPVALAGCDEGPASTGGDEPAGPNPISVDPLDADRLVGAHYYPWYGDPDKELWTRRAVADPVLGTYDSRTDSVINRHIKWAAEHGIRWLSVSWWGPQGGEDAAFNGYNDIVLRDHILESRHADKMKVSILYETAGRFGGVPVDMSDPSNQERLAEDLSYLAETYFGRDTYLRIDGEPVLFIYLAQTYTGDAEAAFRQAFEEAGVDPYVLADIPFRPSLDGLPIAPVVDGITTYNPYAAREDIEQVFHERYADGNRQLADAARTSGVDFIPAAIPGFNDTAIPDERREDNPILEASPERFRRVAGQVQPYLDAAPGVLVTSFNEWFENTQVEPNEEYGQAYLEIVADSLATE